MESGWTRCVVALGSNLGDREDIAYQAAADIAATEGFNLVAASSLHETQALGLDGPNPEAPRYLNQVLLVDSAWSAQKTLEHLLAIETLHGRSRDGVTYADRTLDLDLITYGSDIFATADLTLPHPRAHERRFVLEPWVEIDPEAEIPGHGRVSQLLAALPVETP